MAQPGIRATQLADLIRDILAPAIQRDYAGFFVSIQQVTLSTDLKRGTVWVSVFPATGQAEIIRKLQKASRGYNQLIRHNLNRHAIPTLSFKADTSLEDEARIGELLN